VKFAGSRVHGVHETHRRLALKDDGFGGLVIFRNCKNLVRTLPQMVFSKTNPEDVDPSCDEHGIKALAYGLQREKRWFRYSRVSGKPSKGREVRDMYRGAFFDTSGMRG
jgi:hypothetical protein